MSCYRLYFFDGMSGRIHEFREFEADDDETACAQASSWRRAAPMELWFSGRKVRRWEGVTRPPSCDGAAQLWL